MLFGQYIYFALFDYLELKLKWVKLILRYAPLEYKIILQFNTFEDKDIIAQKTYKSNPNVLVQRI